MPINPLTLPCGGVTITQNTFEKNFGCPLYAGSLISLHCVDSSYDASNYEKDETASEESSEDLKIYLKASSRIVTSVDGEVSPNKIEFSSNVYSENLAGGGEGLIDLRGIRQVNFYNETFADNGENTLESYAYYKVHTDSATSLYSGTVSTFSTPGLSLLKSTNEDLN